MGPTRATLQSLAAALPTFTDEAAEHVAAFDVYRRFYSLPTDTLVSHRIGQININGQRIVCQAWSPPNPDQTVLIVNGLYEHAGLHGQLINYYLARNQRVCLYDTVGHGLSDGTEAAVESFDIYQEILETVTAIFKEVFQCEMNAIGQSTGGGVLIHHVLRHRPCHYQQIIVLSPLHRCAGWWWVTHLHSVLKYFVNKIPRGFSPSSHDGAFVDFLAKRDPLQSRYLRLNWVAAMRAAEKAFYQLPPSDYPLIVLQGDDDDVVDWRYNVPQFNDRFSHLSLHMVAGAKHQLAFESTPYFKKVSQILDGYK